MASEPNREEGAVGEADAQQQTPAPGREPNGSGRDDPGDTGQGGPSADAGTGTPGHHASQVDERAERGEEGGAPDDTDATGTDEDDDDDEAEADNVEYMPRPPADS